MPIFEYICPDHGRFELRVNNRVDADRIDSGVDCPKCGRNAARIVSPVMVRFNGAGFYQTDYKQQGR